MTATTQSAVSTASSRSLLWRWLIVLAPGTAVWLVRIPGLNTGQEHLLGVFLATVISLVEQPVPMGVSVIVAA